MNSSSVLGRILAASGESAGTACSSEGNPGWNAVTLSPCEDGDGDAVASFVGRG